MCCCCRWQPTRFSTTTAGGEAKTVAVRANRSRVRNFTVVCTSVLPRSSVHLLFTNCRYSVWNTLWLYHTRYISRTVDFSKNRYRQLPKSTWRGIKGRNITFTARIRAANTSRLRSALLYTFLFRSFVIHFELY